MQIRSAAKWIAAAAGILVGAVIVGFSLKDNTYRSKIRTDQRSKTVCYSSGENDSKDAEDKKCGNSERDTPSGE